MEMNETKIAEFGYFDASLEDRRNGDITVVEYTPFDQAELEEIGRQMDEHGSFIKEDGAYLLRIEAP